jgi:hypothetical protein
MKIAGGLEARHATVGQTLRFKSAVLEERHFPSLTFIPRPPRAIESYEIAVYHFPGLPALARQGAVLHSSTTHGLSQK